MSIKLFYFVLLGLLHFSWGTLNLQINKKTDNIFYPVSQNVEETVGTTFSLVCELVSSANESQYDYDDQLSWFRNDSKSKPLRTKSTDLKEINKSEKLFQPLHIEDKGYYMCISDKFKLVKGVEVVVRNDVKREPRPMRDMIFCNEHMFQCVSNGLCIIQHYVCDGKPDCKDGSDESLLTCNGADPCRDKIPCDDGRCIPTAWCCDRHHDPNCTVVVRPSCCQSDSYDEIEMEYHSVSQSHQTAKYLFVLVCFVSIAFSVILLFLIISKVVIFAKKAALQQQANRVCENIALRNQTNINVIPCSLYTYRASRTPRNANVVRNIIIDSSDVNDPLLFNPSRFNRLNTSDFHDQPPSYVDVLRSSRAGAEPPPPYQSREAINVTNNSDPETP